MIGPDAFAVLVWGVFVVGWIGVGTIAVAVVREVILLLAAQRRTRAAAPPDGGTDDEGGQR